MFNSEQELVDAFSTKSNDFLESLLKRSVSNSFIVHEFDSQFGIADLVLGTFDSNISAQPKRSSVNPNWIYPLTDLKQGARFELEDFCQIYGLSKNSATKRVLEYEQAGFVKKLESTYFEVKKEYTTVADLVISIEAKLRDWRKAISQAQRYTKFSDLAFVLLDGSKASSALENIEIFKALNIGLVSLNRNDLDVHFIPKKNNRKVPEYFFRINEVAYNQFINSKKTY